MNTHCTENNTKHFSKFYLPCERLDLHIHVDKYSSRLVNNYESFGEASCLHFPGQGSQRRVGLEEMDFLDFLYSEDGD
jgi:hypothetical protein